jgi:hypothetical protein
MRFGSHWMFTRHQAAIAHQLPWIAEAGQRSQFCNDADGNQLAHSAQHLQGSHDFLDLSWGTGHGVVDSPFQALEPVGGMFGFVYVIEKAACKAG